MLYLAATPIGNLEDITLRVLTVLKQVDYILAEDTRKTGILLKHFGIKKPLASFYDHNEYRKTPQVIEDLRAGKEIALVSSAGMPTISDPGYKLVRACRKEQIPITALPGANSIINALALSSLPHESFTFLGYFPRKSSQGKRLLETVAKSEGAAVFFESPFRVLKTLGQIKETVKEAKLTIAREMTKKFEEVWEGSAEQALAYYEAKKPRGEFVIIIKP